MLFCLSLAFVLTLFSRSPLRVKREALFFIFKLMVWHKPRKSVNRTLILSAARKRERRRGLKKVQ